jgi:hypothetical protein
MLSPHQLFASIVGSDVGEICRERASIRKALCPQSQPQQRDVGVETAKCVQFVRYENIVMGLLKKDGLT